MRKVFYREPCLTFGLSKLRICILSAKFNKKNCAVTTALFYTRNILLVKFVFLVVIIFQYFGIFSKSAIDFTNLNQQND